MCFRGQVGPGDREGVAKSGSGNHSIGPSGQSVNRNLAWPLQGTLAAQLTLALAALAASLPHGAEVMKQKPLRALWTQRGSHVRGHVSCCHSDTSATCYKDQGITYRGTWSTAESGAECVNWNSSVLALKPYSARRPGSFKLGLGNHNYCR